ncbi:MAG: superoxide dismutase [Thermoguttaceae bacterium]|nr:superoxide dismutase [Thermoguttaceae bacterium]
MERRQMLTITAAVGLHALWARPNEGHAQGQYAASEQRGAAFEQAKLPYGLGDLAPFLSEEQMSYHYGKHHAAYFKKLNELVLGKPEAQWRLEEIIAKSDGPLFNNAAQTWNHTFFWNCMAPNGGGKADGKLGNAIERCFGDYGTFETQFKTEAAKLFGSGWLWLAADAQGSLTLLPLANAGNPITHGKTPILTIDVWEHAYYVDYRNNRAQFIEEFMKRINWPFVQQCYENTEPA